MKVGVIMGSVSDYEVMADAVAMLERFGVDRSEEHTSELQSQR